MPKTRANLTDPAKQVVQHDLSDEAAIDHWLTNLLAQRVMGWRVGPDRFRLGQRKWLQFWKFQPTERIEHAFQLLTKAAPTRYTVRGDDTGFCCVQVEIEGAIGEARDRSGPRALTFAIARALSIDIGDRDEAPIGA